MSSSGRSRKRLYKQRKPKKRSGRVERLKEAVQRRNEKLDNLNRHTMALKKLATKVTLDNKTLKRLANNSS